MFHRIDSETSTGVFNLRGNITDQDLNGLMIAMNRAPAGTDYMTVTLKKPGATQEILVNRINLIALSEISAFHGGMSDQLEARLVADEAQLAAPPANLGAYMFAVPLGCLRNVGNGSTLEVLVEFGAAGTAAVYTYFLTETADFFLKYLESELLNNTYHGVDFLFLYVSSGIEDGGVFGTNANIFVKSRTQATTCDFAGVVAATYTLGNLPAQGNLYTVIAYKNKDGLPGDVTINVSGADVGDITIISIERVTDPVRVAQSIKQSAIDKSSVMESLPASQQKALVSAGHTAPVSTLRQVSAMPVSQG